MPPPPICSDRQRKADSVFRLVQLQFNWKSMTVAALLAEKIAASSKQTTTIPRQTKTSVATKLAHLPPHHQERSKRGGDSRTGGIDVVFGCDSVAVAREEGAGGIRLHPPLHPPHVPPRRRPGLVGLLRRVVGVFLCCVGASRCGASRVGRAVGEQVGKASAEHAAEMERLISQLPLCTLVVLPKSSRARCRHPLLLRAVFGEKGDCRRRTEGQRWKRFF
uniref:Uncharacterized protein n=1 Tax=Oryza barthii TaxID=65489 RepID=A0A0D3H944_9ORYZ